MNLRSVVNVSWSTTRGRIAQRGVVDAPVAQPEQQGSLGRVADHAGVGVQESRRVGRDALVDDRVGRIPP